MGFFCPLPSIPPSKSFETCEPVNRVWESSENSLLILCDSLWMLHLLLCLQNHKHSPTSWPFWSDQARAEASDNGSVLSVDEPFVSQQQGKMTNVCWSPAHWSIIDPGKDSPLFYVAWIWLLRDTMNIGLCSVLNSMGCIQPSMDYTKQEFSFSPMLQPTKLFLTHPTLFFVPGVRGPSGIEQRSKRGTYNEWEEIIAPSSTSRNAIPEEEQMVGHC